MISGDVESGIYIMDFDTTFSEGCNFSGLAPLQRIKACFTHDKATYNQEIFNNNGSGDFDTNLINIRFHLSDSIPLPNQPFPATGQTTIQLTNELINDDTVSRTNCATFRVDEQWANLNESRYVTCVWTFRYTNVNGEQQDDQVRKTICFNFNKYDDGTGIQFNQVVDGEGNTISDFYCSNYDGFLYPEFTNLLPNTYTQLAFYESQSGNINEDNQHSNNMLPTLTTPLIGDIQPVNPININDDFRFCVNPQLLNEDTEYCFTTLLIQENPLPSGVECPCITLTLAQTLTNQNTQQFAFSTLLTLGNGIVASEVQNVQVFYNGTIIGSSSFNNSLTGTVILNLPVTNPQITSNYLVNVTSTEGCNYSFGVNLPTFSITVTESDCAPMLCNLVAPSPEDGSMVFVTIDSNTDCANLSASDPVATLLLCMTNTLTTLGYQFGTIIINSSDGTLGQTTYIEITDTDLAASDLTVIYEDYGTANVSSDCSQGDPTTWLIDDFANASLNTVQRLRLGTGAIAVNGPWSLQLAGQQAQMETDIQNWLDSNGGGTVTVTNPAPLPNVRIEITGTTAALNGASLVGITNPYFVEQ